MPSPPAKDSLPRSLNVPNEKQRILQLDFVCVRELGIQQLRMFLKERTNAFPPKDISRKSSGGCCAACNSFKVQGIGRARWIGKAQKT
mmetsp:Transcript_1970/g.7342  ORF Transcript_1970/g.7342 Transcript_1970/m.7342 type:complete len:88 (-) Transcript_1970:390-653(-)